MNERWTIEEIDEGRKHMIRREDRRCIAIVHLTQKAEEVGDNVLLMFANSNRMLAVCRKLTYVWNQDGIQAVIAEAASIINDIEDEGDSKYE